MHTYNPNKIIFANILFCSQLLMGCLSPSIGLDKAGTEPVEGEKTSRFSPLMRSTKQEDKVQAIALQSVAHGEERAKEDQQISSFQIAEEDHPLQQLPGKTLLQSKQPVQNGYKTLQTSLYIADNPGKISNYGSINQIPHNELPDLLAKTKALQHKKASAQKYSHKQKRKGGTAIKMPKSKRIKATLSRGTRSTALPSGKEGKEGEIDNATASASLGVLALLPIDILEIMLSYLGSKGMNKLRALNRHFYKFTTGYNRPGQISVNNLPFTIPAANWGINTRIVDFRQISGLTPENIPSFPWFQLVGEVKHPPQCFWSYIASTQVHTLNLEGDKIGDKGTAELAKALPGTRVHKLYLYGNEIGADGIDTLAKALPSTQIHILHLEWNAMGIKETEMLAKFLPSTQVHVLDLTHNQIGAGGARALAVALPSTQVHTLYLEGNQIGDEGIAELAKALPSTQVHLLHLYNNEIGDTGLKELSRALPSTQVHKLNLGDNQIGNEGIKMLAKSLHNSQIHTLDLEGNQIDNEGLAELSRALTNTRLHTLDLGGNQISDEGVEMLAKSLPNSQVYTLYLEGNQIGDEMANLLKQKKPYITWYF